VEHAGPVGPDTKKNVWPAPSASGFRDPFLSNLRQRIRPADFPRPRWRSARPGPHKTPGVERHFFNQVSGTPIDCQAISRSPPADLIGQATPL
jgi:hypothetical protein